MLTPSEILDFHKNNLIPLLNERLKIRQANPDQYNKGPFARFGYSRDDKELAITAFSALLQGNNSAWLANADRYLAILQDGTLGEALNKYRLGLVGTNLLPHNPIVSSAIAGSHLATAHIAHDLSSYHLHNFLKDAAKTALDVYGQAKSSAPAAGQSQGIQAFEVVSPRSSADTKPSIDPTLCAQARAEAFC